ncbi:MAG: 1,5-anhydro-D-fructose reductase [Alphaproteobacteria bacterium MarineAlpha5_Bin5]|nr:MAG: 1,5-anhydro-D-fructose reductase [Alphaproteobacteria bacterium MarineAlpha5_Bin4]PPR49944.1 MAG: 1,5-anhydro-D-fructose reductase [Alphaproteobacteria bacterium MarineAlpha5_Bin5]|tara:strand:- start:364 stop:1407 length:1044 start_codon:yes stop_codon:yes gene_type:complete
MPPVRWGIIGPGSIAHNFADALKESYSGKLQAIASLNSQRREEFGNKYKIENHFRFKTYEELLNSSDVDAVYISTPHTLHAELSIKAAGKGKHILCEKPAAVNLLEGQKVINSVREAGVFYVEGFMYRCHPQIPALLKLIKDNKIGKINKIISSFGFDMKKIIPNSRLFDKNLAGGAILDVGLYPISFSRLIAGVATGKKFLNPIEIDAEARIGETGVDEIATANLRFDNNITAKVSTAILKNMKNNSIIEGSEGYIELDQPWAPGRDSGPYHSKIKINIKGKEEILEFKGPEHLFFFEAELSSQTILKERLEVPHPGMTWEDTLGNLKVLDEWRKKIGYFLPQDIN